MIELIVKGIFSYLLGSVIGSLLIARFTGGVDIRKLGSGNAGATNALRTQGKAVAFGVLVIDLAKGWVATALLAPAVLPGITPAAAELRGWSTAGCALAVMLGHVYPIWYGFRGGKGMATLVGTVLGVQPWLLVPMVLTWFATVILFGFVGLASMTSAVALALAVGLSTPSPRTPLLAYAMLAALLIIFTHRSNIARMRAGSESRARTLWLLGARRSQR